jgi:hypothetical protein
LGEETEKDMGLYDTYCPNISYKCQNCASSIDGYQGKDGPNGLFLFKEGFDGAFDQTMDQEFKISKDKLAKIKLPNRFEIYTFCDKCNFMNSFVGTAVNGKWVSTNRLCEDNAVPYPGENESDFISRVRYLKSIISDDVNEI